MTDAIPDPAHATKISGEILFAVSLAFALSIFLLNSSLADRRELRDKQAKRHYALSKTVDRLHSFRAKDGALFKELAVSSLTIASLLTSDNEARRYPGLIRKVQTGPNSWNVLELDEHRLWKLQELAKGFGEKAAQAFAAHPSQDDRVREFRTLVEQAFKDDPEAALFLSNEVVSKLAAIDSASEWWRIARWIADGTWPTPGGSGGIVVGDRVTFGKRLDDPSEYEDRFYVHDLMLNAPNSRLDEELFNLWKESYNNQRTSGPPSPGVTVPLLGMSISAEAVVAGAAPLLVLLQLLFLVHWERRSSVSPTDHDAFTFPSFACPNDPLNGPIPKTLGEVAQRLIWALFLILPTILLAIGALTRYDILYPLGYYGNGRTMTLFEAELSARSEDVLSSTLDWITLTCTALSAMTVLSITRPRSALKGTSTLRRRVLTLGGWLIAIIAAIICIRTTWSAFNAYVAPLENASDVHSNMHYLAAFGVLWSLWLGVACHRRARLLVMLSIAGLAVFVLHFVRF